MANRYEPNLDNMGEGAPNGGFVKSSDYAAPSTVTPTEGGSLTERLRAFAAGCRSSMWQSREETIRLCEEAASALEVKEAELVAMKTKADCWQAEFLNACRDAASFSDDLLRAEAALAEERKALEEIAGARSELNSPHDYSRGWNDALFRVRQIARRVREGGEDNG